ncbi:xylulokinase [Emticicia sp. SJ17W-69]|uniref:xylulokinase n=1 Tax=Emticicia sp. SJ17W-69 TaxID=3421657 RepID=UPI003EBB727F
MYLIINLGLKSIRGIVFNEIGEQIYSKAYPVHTSLFLERVEQDANEWMTLLYQILDDLKNNTDLSKQISHISATTSSSCILGINSQLKPVTKVLMVSDKRTVEEVSIIKSNPLFKKEYVCTTSALIPKALWFKNHEKSTFENVKYWMGAGELINLIFTGEIFTDPLNASKAFYQEGKGYDIAVLNDLGISPESLPPVKPIGFEVPISKELIINYNLNTDCKFILTTYDAICAVIGSSNGDSNNACDVSGTVTSVRMLHEQELKSNNTILLVQHIEFLNNYLIGASNNLGGGIIEWFKQAFYNSENDNAYFQMDNQAQQSTIGAGGVIFLPYLLGERAPFTSPNASGSFFGINRSTTLKDFTRAVFESAAFVTRDLLELIENSGVTVQSLTVSGGLARFDLINQIKADVCNKPVYVVDNFESTSIGAFLLMALAQKKFLTLKEGLKKVVKVRKVIYPSEKNRVLYDNYFHLYKSLNERLTPLYDTHKFIKDLKIIHENEIVRNL